VETSGEFVSNFGSVKTSHTAWVEPPLCLYTGAANWAVNDIDEKERNKTGYPISNNILYLA